MAAAAGVLIEADAVVAVIVGPDGTKLSGSVRVCLSVCLSASL